MNYTAGGTRGKWSTIIRQWLLDGVGVLPRRSWFQASILLFWVTREHEFNGSGVFGEIFLHDYCADLKQYGLTWGDTTLGNFKIRSMMQLARRRTISRGKTATRIKSRRVSRIHWCLYGTSSTHYTFKMISGGNVTYPFLGRDGKAETLWTNEWCIDKMEDKKALKTWQHLYGGLSREEDKDSAFALYDNVGVVGKSLEPWADGILGLGTGMGSSWEIKWKGIRLVSRG